MSTVYTHGWGGGSIPAGNIDFLITTAGLNGSIAVLRSVTAWQANPLETAEIEIGTYDATINYYAPWWGAVDQITVIGKHLPFLWRGRAVIPGDGVTDTQIFYINNLGADTLFYQAAGYILTPN